MPGAVKTSLFKKESEEPPPQSDVCLLRRFYFTEVAPEADALTPQLLFKKGTSQKSLTH